MEELVLSEAITKVAEIEASTDRTLDVGDIAAYALNRLPPLYATTEEGANFQRSRAREQLLDLISKQVTDAIEQSLAHPEFFPERQLLGKTNPKEVLSQVSMLLEAYAENFEAEEQQAKDR